MRLFVTIVLDGVGIGEQPDSGDFGDEGSDTLGHVCASRPLTLPWLAGLGLGNIRPLDGVEPAATPLASFGKLTEVSPGKDSTTGHWELAGIVLKRPFPLYPDGFPDEMADAFARETGTAGWLGNRPASGTDIIAELGDEHVRSGRPIVYTSADSVFQIAAHLDVIPLDRQYEICRIARDRVCTGDNGVGRVIARPFQGVEGRYERVSALRKDFALKPAAGTIQEALQQVGVRTVSIGKVADLFGGVGFDESYKTRSNEQGVQTLIACMRDSMHEARPTFIWINLIDFDQEYGHRNNTEGFATALETFDGSLASIIALVPAEGRLAITADHGNDPTTPSTDHSREYVPLLYYGAGSAEDLGTRTSFTDHAATIGAYFGAEWSGPGTPFESFGTDN